MLRKILLALVLAVLVVLAIGLFLPREYTVSRSVTIRADKARVHALTSDLSRWSEWSPWEDDESLTKTLGPVTSGVGASQAWTSDSGDGRLVMTKSDPEEGIAYDLVFGPSGSESPAQGWMTYSGVGDAVVVTWGMSGEWDMPVLGGWVARMADRMMGPDFDQGLKTLKHKAELR